MLAKIGEEVRRNWPHTEIAISHRIGKLDISESAVVIVVSSPHRKAAYQANEYAIERIKEMVPIWKKKNVGKMEKNGLVISLKISLTQQENQK